jgi:uncharacterized repeat protein (TIGR01451 family)
MRKSRAGASVLLPLAVIAGAWVLAHPVPAHASICAIDAWNNGNGTIPAIIYPNWTALRAGSFDVWLCDGCGTGPETLVALTVCNFGTADNGDIKTVYFKASCGATSTGLQTMTYAGVYSEDSGNWPAWTWKGTSPNLAGCADLCGAPACGGYYSIDVYCDIQPCPTNLDTVLLGFPINSTNNPTYWGSIIDNFPDWAPNSCPVPWYDMAGDMATIAYVYKQGVDSAVPGDTVEYTIYYGKPGTNVLSKIDIVDSIPQYTHYVENSASPACDLGWDPAIGIPSKLRWTLAGGAPGWGATLKVTFKLSVDWGNGEAFEPGSGDVGAPEGIRLKNIALASFYGVSAGCPTGGISPPVATVCKRFMFWCIGDNDILFSATYGQPADEMIYSTFIKNISQTKTWWDVHLWDTVPTDLDVWAVDCGFYDPCTGWTMTPSGCVAAGAGKVLTAGSKTLLTWKLDMPPQYTMELRWKAKVSPNAQAKGTVINLLTVLEYGHPNIVDGTGSSVTPRRFTHLAPIILPTMYTSYVGYGMSAIACPGFFLFFEPLNKKTQFEVRQLFFKGPATYAALGGVSPSIGNLIGDCITGFPGGGWGGCKAERVPALYDPTSAYPGMLDPAVDATRQCVDEIFPLHWIHKMTANSPTLWQCLTWESVSNQDNMTYAPATTLSYTGFMHYCFMRTCYPAYLPGYGDGLALINTGMDAYGNFLPDQETTVYIFKFDYTSLTWNVTEMYDLGPESCAFAGDTPIDEVGPYRTISSECALIVNQGIEINQRQDGGGRCDNNEAFFPTRETGNTVSLPGQVAHFYGIHNGQGSGGKVAIGNLSSISNTTFDATYKVWRYVPDNTVTTITWMPSYLNGTSGTWRLQGTHNVPGGLNNVDNPRVYNADGAFFDFTNAGLMAAKVELLSGGPIQVLAGISLFSEWAGGAVLHAADGKQTGMEYWLHYLPNGATSGAPARNTYAIDVFASKQGMQINLTSGAGLSVTYTTTGPDQCVAFLSGGIQWPTATQTNYKIRVMPNGNEGNVVAQFIANDGSEKGYTAPFLQEGIHYEIIAPPVVYIGQLFWITIVVKDTSGFTKADYNGTSSFTSTDPSAKILGAAMDATNYTWNGCGTDCGVKIFVQVQFTKIGMQTIVAMDTMDGSINGLTAIMVVAADIKLEKRKKLSVAASGDTVQFWICWSNYSSATGYSFTITDAVPNGTTYVPELASNAICGQNGPATASASMAASNSTSTSAPNTAFVYVAPATSPANTTRWLRWTIRDVYVNSTGCVCFKVIVN